MFTRVTLVLLGVLVMSALLTIGTDVERIDLLGGQGWRLSSWRPLAAEHAAIVGQSEMGDGQQVESYREANIVETWGLELGQPTPDMAIRATQDLRRMLRKALNYWTTKWQSKPVYLAARAPKETNTRYALVHDGRLPSDSPPYEEPFNGAVPGLEAAGMDEMELQIEHGPWREVPPGQQVCVEVSATGAYFSTQTTVTVPPLASTDDATYVVSSGAWLQGGLTLYLGDSGVGSYDTGIRFPLVNVPAGATIVQAYIRFVADQNSADDYTSLVIFGHKQPNALTFASASDYLTRPLTDASVVWAPSQWTLGNSYSSADLSPIVQEIIDQAGWAALNGMSFRIKNNLSASGAARAAASWDNLVRAEPVLTIVYATPVAYGQEETCGIGAYVANKQNMANITHIYRNDGGVWSANLFTGHPYDLFPAAPVQNNDAVYFGILSAPDSAGPFCSLVFDISPAATWVSAGPGVTAYVAYEYWTGAAWAALTTIVDNTASTLAQPFGRAGVGSMHWVPPANWAPNNPGMGVTAWWVRVRVVLTGAGDSVTVPTQVNREVYTVTWGSCLIAADQVPGDIPALLRAIIHCPSGEKDWNSTFGIDRLVMGIRGTERGTNFSAYINLSGQQNPAGINVTATPEFALTASPLAVTGDWQVLTPPAMPPATSDWHVLDYLLVSLDHAAVQEYAGTYHAFIRAQVIPGAGGAAGDLGLRLAMGSWPYMPGATVYSQECYNKDVSVNELFDLGRITIPVYNLRQDGTPSNYCLVIQWRVLDDDFTVAFHDLILIPVDEWAANVEAWEEGTTFPDVAVYYTLGRLLLDVDGVLDARHRDAYIVMKDSGYMAGGAYPRIYAWMYSANGDPVLTAGREQRLWITGTRPNFEGTTLYRAGIPYAVFMAQLFRSARYLSARGDR